MLFEDLKNGRILINGIRQRLRNIDKDTSLTPLEIMAEKDELKKAEKQYYKYALSPGMYAKEHKDEFIYKQVVLYTRFVEKRHQYKELIEKNNYTKYIENNFDKNKTALLVVNGYLDAMETTKNRDKKLKYYNLVELYLNSEKVDRNAEIIVDGNTINYNTISAKAKLAYNKLNRATIEVEWELLPTGSGYKTGLGTKGRSISMPQDELEKLKEKNEKRIKVGREQTEYFNNTNYVAKAIGLKKFKGYFAYMYPNGVVVLEKDFKEKYPSTADGAIYTMHAKDFELLSGIGKTDLIYNPLLIDHNYHNGDWKSKIDAYINQEGQQDDIEYTKTLIKRLEDKKKKNI